MASSPDERTASHPAGLADLIQRKEMTLQRAAEMLASKLEPENGAAASTDAQSSTKIGNWLIIERSITDTGQRLKVDCGSPQQARLTCSIAAQIPDAPAIQLVAEGQPWIYVTVESHVPFPTLVDRLGWPPPRAIVDRWLKQIDTWKAICVSHQWPLDRGEFSELEIDDSAKLRWPWLAIRIAQSVVSNDEAKDAKQTPNAFDDSASTNASFTELALPVFARMQRLIAFVPSDASTLPPHSEPQPHGEPQPHSEPQTHTKPEGTEPRPIAIVEATVDSQKRQSHRRKKKPLTGVFITGSLVLVVLVLAAWQFSGGGSDSETAAISPASANAPGKAGLFNEYQNKLLKPSFPSEHSPSTDVASVQTTASDAYALQSLQSLNVPGAIESSSTIAEGLDGALDGTLDLASIDPEWTLPELDVTSIAGPPIDDVADGFSVGPQPRVLQETENASATHHGIPNPAPAQFAVSSGNVLTLTLPLRSDHQPKRLPIPVTVTPKSVTIESPSAAIWKLEQSGNETSLLRLFDARTSDANLAVAEILWPSDLNRDGGVVFRWTDNASNNPVVESLRNMRFAYPDEKLFLREPIHVSSLAPSLSEKAPQYRWPLSTAPDIRQTTATLQVTDKTQDATVEPGDAAGLQGAAKSKTEPLIYRWLAPIESTAGKKLRGLLEVSLKDESPVRVRIRTDLQIGREISFGLVAVASLDPAFGWQGITTPTIQESVERLAELRTNSTRLLTLVDQQYSQVVKSDARTLLRQRRDRLEDQEKLLEQYSERLLELQILVARIEAELTFEMSIATHWPDSMQTIFVAKD